MRLNCIAVISMCPFITSVKLYDKIFYTPDILNFINFLNFEKLRIFFSLDDVSPNIVSLLMVQNTHLSHLFFLKLNSINLSIKISVTVVNTVPAVDTINLSLIISLDRDTEICTVRAFLL